MRITIAIGLVTGAWLAGCGGGHGDPIPLDEYPARSAAFSCAHFFDCCDDTELMTLFSSAMPPPANEAECRAYYEAQIGTYYATIREQVAAGRVVWDAQAAGDCLAQAEGLACDEQGLQLYVSNEACQTTLRGTVADGGACESGLECVSQSCDLTAHVCVTRAHVGESCAGMYTCEIGAYCRTDGMGGAVCTALHGDGEACTMGYECTSGTCTAGACDGATFCDGR